MTKVSITVIVDTFDSAKPRFLNRGKKRRSVSTLSIPRASDRGVEWVDSKGETKWKIYMENNINILAFEPVESDSLLEVLKKSGVNIIVEKEIGKIPEKIPDFILLTYQNNFTLQDINNLIRACSAPLLYLGIPPSHLKNNIDDYIPLPVDHEYLVFKIKSLSRRIRTERDINPLTGLPGNRMINLQLNHAYQNANHSIAYIDINDFKPYNDTYGFGKGDEVIRSLGKILYNEMFSNGQKTFLGHIGGDDFVMIGPDQEIENISREIISRFENTKAVFFSEKDMNRGSFVSMDRDGKRRNFPLLSICIVSFPVLAENFRDIHDITQRAVYLKKWIKAQSPPQGKSIFFKEEKEKSGAILKKLEELALSGETAYSIRRSIIEALGELGDSSSFSTLMKLLNPAEPIKIRKSAIYALGRLKDSRAVAPLLEILSDPSPHLRARAVEALGEIGKNEAYGSILKMVSEENNFVRQKVMLSLGKLGNQDSYTFLEKAADDSDTTVSENAIRAIGEIKNPEAIPLLNKFLKHQNSRYRILAIEALGKIFHAEAAAVLCSCLDDKNPYVQWQVISRLPQFIERGLLKEKHNFIMERLMATANSRNDYLKRASIIALGALKDSRNLPSIFNALESKNDLVRWSAVISLGKIGDKASIPYLLSSCSDKDDFVRASCAWALGEINGNGSLEPLRQMLKDPSSRVRESAASAIVKIAHSLYF